MKDLVLPIYNLEGKQIDKISLDPQVFDGRINKNAIYQAVVCFRANQRKGLASTKTRGEVSGGGKKPWRQKGTGRARVGSIRSPLWRHGGVVFGPHPRDFSLTIPQKIKLLALKSSLNAKLKEDNFIILDDFILEQPKTKEALKVFTNLKINAGKTKKKKKVLLVLEKFSPTLKMALRNISFLEFSLAKDIHAYEVLKNNKLLITKKALEVLGERFK